jgi:hypothetical protein
MRFAFEVRGSVVAQSRINGAGPKPLARTYRIVGCSAASARDTASQLYLADVAAQGLRPAGEVTVVPAPDSAPARGN